MNYDCWGKEKEKKREVKVKEGDESRVNRDGLDSVKGWQNKNMVRGTAAVRHRSR